MSGLDDATRPIGPARRTPPVPPPVPSPTGATASAPEAGDRGPSRSGRRFAAALAWTVANTAVPGVGFLAAGRRRIGIIVLVGFVLLVGAAVWLVTAGQSTAVDIAVDTVRLRWVIGAVVAVALLWASVVVLGYRALLPRPTTVVRHLVGGLVVLVLLAAIAYPAVKVGEVAAAQRDLIDQVFPEDRQSATVDPSESVDLFGDQDRVNVLLLGGDGGEGRDGVRTDTVVVASIDTDSGNTELISLPRNLENLPFPAGSPLAAVYPDGFDAGSESESLLNAVYRNGPAMYPDILGPSADPGADFLKLGVGEALGLDIDYFVLVNLDGFARLVDALGGITVNVNYYVPINGDPGTGELPDDYIAPGPDQHMDGTRALQFARGRFGLTDYDRMARQRCTIDAIIDQADPLTLLADYQELAAATSDIVSTDIPRSALSDFVELGSRVKDAEVTSLVLDDSVISPAYPDYDAIRELVRRSLGAVPAPSTEAPSTGVPSTEVPTDSPSTDAPDSLTDVTDACAYDPFVAGAAIEAGEPRSKAG